MSSLMMIPTYAENNENNWTNVNRSLRESFHTAFFAIAKKTLVWKHLCNLTTETTVQFGGYARLSVLFI